MFVDIKNRTSRQISEGLVRQLFLVIFEAIEHSIEYLYLMCPAGLGEDNTNHPDCGGEVILTGTTGGTNYW